VVFVGFAILAGLWPFHTWAPTGHVAAPTAASMLLAGVVMKLGAYGALRVAMTLFPIGLHTWQNTIAVLAVVGIVYGALVALVQQDFKFVIGYSSVSHMGFVLLGLMTLTQIGLSGAVLQMFSHGIIAGLLFAVVGRMVYDRTHTRDLAKLQPMNLNQVLPFAAVTFVVGCAASMGLPGFSGFVAELQVLVGAWQTFPVFAILAAAGILAGVAYTLRVLLKAFFAEGEVDARDLPHCQRISLPERAGALLLLGTTLVIGLWPQLLLQFITPSLNSPLMQPLWKAGIAMNLYLECLTALTPEIIVVATALLVLLVDLAVVREKPFAHRAKLDRRDHLPGLLAGDVVAGAGCLVRFPLAMLAISPMTQWLKMPLLLLTIFAAVLSWHERFTRHAGEYFACCCWPRRA
jgi:NADH-quinone oxidoreductase subunit M